MGKRPGQASRCAHGGTSVNSSSTGAVCLHFKALQHPPSNWGHALPQATASQTCAARVPAVSCPIPACRLWPRPWTWVCTALCCSTVFPNPALPIVIHRAPDHPPPPCAVPCVTTHLKTLNLPACPPLSRGHASENPDLPAALAERNIRFLGPGSVAMAALGDKVRPAPLCPLGTRLWQRRSAPCTVVQAAQHCALLLHRQASSVMNHNGTLCPLCLCLMIGSCATDLAVPTVMPFDSDRLDHPGPGGRCAHPALERHRCVYRLLRV